MGDNGNYILTLIDATNTLLLFDFLALPEEI
jgi:hypothetical protein